LNVSESNIPAWDSHTSYYAFEMLKIYCTCWKEWTTDVH